MNNRGNGLPDLAMLTNAEVTYKYYFWLCELVRGDVNYSNLMRTLHAKPFFWSVPNDDNRAFEGKELRCKFCHDCNIYYDYSQYDMAASMLELIIGLAYRCESIMSDQADSHEMRWWFWKILSNVRLELYDDDMWKETNADSVVDAKLNKIIERGYERNGNGGLFPLKRNKKDQRKVELWYQLNAYLVENYYTE